MSDPLLLEDVTADDIPLLVCRAYAYGESWAGDYDDDSILDLYSEAKSEVGSRPAQIGNLLFSCADRQGGYSGEGEYSHVVWKIEDCNNARYFKETGSYYSFVGLEWHDNLKEVFPRIKEVTVYE